MHRPRPLISLAAVALASLAPSIAHAQDAAPGEEQDIVVSAHALGDLGLMAGSVTLEGDALVRAAAPPIGELLASLPGVSATGFAPGASRPVLRGLTGDRVQVLIDSLGALDASSVSADHGVALETLTIDHVDVLHGPAVLAFGGQAIGGAVNAYDKRIPRRIPDGPVALVAEGGFSSVTSGVKAAAALDVPLGGGLVAHADASWTRDGDQRVGGLVLSPELRALEPEFADLNGRIANSFSHGTTFGAGLAWLGEGGNLGISVQRIDRQYGIPSRPGVGEEEVSIDLGQTRFDLRGSLKLDGFLESIDLRAAYADYDHAEIVDASPETRFARKAGALRLEAVQADHGGWTGRSGLQFDAGRLTVTGAESILPANRDRRLGLFTLQQVKLGKLELEAAGRIEHVGIRSESAGFDRGFTLLSGAAGLALRPQEGLKLGINFSHGERAPSPEELLTEGIHAATQSFEQGDSSFNQERSNGLEAYVKYDSPATRLSLTGYANWFTGFITPIPTGGSVEGFPVYAYQQLAARFAGFEAQLSQRLLERGDARLTLEASADYVHARLGNGAAVPGVAPLRLMGGLEYADKRWTLRGDVEWNARQTRVGAFENPTDSFALVGVSAAWRPMGEKSALTLLLSADNLFDVVGRRAASLTRDFAPIAGRDLRITLRLNI
jgi:iron complex outermembrane recepter protein